MRPSGKLKVAAGLVACITLLWGAGPRVTRAAGPPNTPPQTTEVKKAPPAPIAIPASEIIPRSEQTLRALKEIRFQVVTDSEAALKSMQSDIAAFAEKSDRRWQDEREVISKLRSLQQLNDILRHWTLEQSQLDDWDRALSRHSQILIAQEKDIGQIFANWQVTRAAGTLQAFPPLAMQKIAEVLREADAVRMLIRDNMAMLLNLQNQLANRRKVLAQLRNDIDKAREKSSRQLFVLDSLPLWQALFRTEARDVIVIQALQSSQRFVEDLQEFPRKYGDRIVWHTVYFLGMVVLIHLLRRGLTPEAAERLGASSAIFFLDRPFATSFLLALVAVPLFYRGAATSVLRIATLPTFEGNEPTEKRQAFRRFGRRLCCEERHPTSRHAIGACPKAFPSQIPLIHPSSSGL